MDALLNEVSVIAGATVVLAIESGSRAWGFPSPDSDYDCRFIYVRHLNDYLTLFPKRNVIEFPIDGLIDVNGWDLAKTLQLLLKGNAVVVEWLMSPYAYMGDASFRDEALALAQQVVRPSSVALHYLHLGERQRRVYFADGRKVPIKKLFYVLRPAMALRWLRLHAGQAVAPMHFPTLVEEGDLPVGVRSVIDDLLQRKAETRELGHAPLPESIGEFVDAEFSWAREFWGDEANDIAPGDQMAADNFFRRWVMR